jgi:hypothetical protein
MPIRMSPAHGTHQKRVLRERRRAVCALPYPPPLEPQVCPQQPTARRSSPQCSKAAETRLRHHCLAAWAHHTHTLCLRRQVPLINLLLSFGQVPFTALWGPTHLVDPPPWKVPPPPLASAAQASPPRPKLAAFLVPGPMRGPLVCTYASNATCWTARPAARHAHPATQHARYTNPTSAPAHARRARSPPRAPQPRGVPLAFAPMFLARLPRRRLAQPARPHLALPPQHSTHNTAAPTPARALMQRHTTQHPPPSP